MSPLPEEISDSELKTPDFRLKLQAQAHALNLKPYTQLQHSLPQQIFRYLHGIGCSAFA